MTLVVRRILCGIDFSPASAAALDLSIDLARVHGAEVRAVHAFVVPAVPFVESGIVTIEEGRWVAALERDLRAFAAEREDPARPIECHAVTGWPAQAILREAHESRADLIVVGTRGLSALPRFLLGSVVERIARTSPVPVLIVPEPSTAERHRPIRTIVCGIDFSEPAAAAQAAAAALATKHRASLHLVHAWEPPPLLARHPEIAAENEHDLERALEAQARGAPADAIRVTTRVRRGAPYEAIAEEARDVNADLIVIGSTGRSSLTHFLLGSVAERVPRLSHVPVLVAR